MIRHVLSRYYGLPSNTFTLTRTDKGKPILLSTPQIEATGLPKLLFNVSHSGRYAVLAAGCYKSLGVDVSDVRQQDDIPKYFDLMQNQFAADEWLRIKARPTPHLQLLEFHRYWALKESYVKATGDGIGFGLQRMSFFCTPELHTKTFEMRRLYTAATLAIDKRPMSTWRFEQAQLDLAHPVATAVDAESDVIFPTDLCFEEFAIDDLVKSLVPMRSEESRLVVVFEKMKDRPERFPPEEVLRQ
jgi:4'-phosphopantetheinyl transferase